MKTWQHLWRLIRFLPGRYGSMLVLRTLAFMVVPNAVALANKEFFDSLTGEAQLGWGPYPVVALLVSIALARAVVIFGDIICFFLSRFTMDTLLRRNLLAHILDQPGSQALPASPGEAVSRFRGDVEAISEFMVFSPFKLAHLIYIPVALFVMVQVNALITTVVFLPLLIIIIAVRIASPRLQRYREANREATGQVTGFIGELFRMVEAVKLTNAEARVMGRFDQLNSIRLDTTIKDRMLSAILNSISDKLRQPGHGHNPDSGRPVHADGELHRRRFRALRLLSPADHVGQPQHRLGLGRIQADRCLHRAPGDLAGERTTAKAGGA